MQTEVKNYYCPHGGCKSTFTRPYRLEQHLLVHDNVKLFACSEVNCSKSYTSKSHLDRHINAVHADKIMDIIFSCPNCLKTYANRQNLKRHIKTHNLNAFSCDICKMEYKKKNQLSAHMYLHTGTKSFSCKICLKEFVSLYEKKKHMSHHKTYKCVECEMEFNQWSKYQKHIKAEHISKEFICDDCGRSFNKRDYILRHVKIHMRRTFPCNYENCDRTYSRNSNLKQHILMKHYKVCHECSVCKAQLSTKDKLNHHMRIHAQGKIARNAQKTLATGRKERKDKGLPKTPIILKLTGVEVDTQII